MYIYIYIYIYIYSWKFVEVEVCPCRVLRGDASGGTPSALRDFVPHGTPRLRGPRSPTKSEPPTPTRAPDNQF